MNFFFSSWFSHSQTNRSVSKLLSEAYNMWLYDYHHNAAEAEVYAGHACWRPHCTLCTKINHNVDTKWQTLYATVPKQEYQILVFFFNQYRKCALECQCCWNGTSHQMYAHRNRSLCRQCECLQCEKKLIFGTRMKIWIFFSFAPSHVAHKSAAQIVC